MLNETKIPKPIKAFLFLLSLAIFSSVIFLGTPVLGQTAGENKKTLSDQDLGKWERLGFRGTALSDDGKWLIYPISKNNKKNELRLHDLSKDSTKVLKEGGSSAFSSDSKWLGYLISPDFDTQKALREKKKPVRNTFELIDLATGKTSQVKNISSFRFSEDGKFLVLKPYPPEKSESKSSDIIVKNLATNTATVFGNVKDYEWSDEGSILAAIIETKDKIGNGVKLYDGKTSITLDSKDAIYSRLVWRKNSNDLAVFRSQENEKFEGTTNDILVWKNASISGLAPRQFDPTKFAGFPKEMRILDDQQLQWSLNGNSLFFSIDKWEKSPAKPKEKPSETPTKKKDLPEIPELEIWNSRDVRAIPEQRSRPYDESIRSVWHLDKNSFVQIKDVRLQPDSPILIAFDNKPYEFEGMFGRPSADLYAVDIRTGQRKKILTDVIYPQVVSSNGSSFVYLKDDHYHIFNPITGADTNVSQGLDDSFINLDDDYPVKQKRPYGFIGWDKTGSYFLAHSKYDIWKFEAKTGKATMLTNGKPEKTIHRLMRLDRSERYIDLEEEVYVRKFGEWNKKSGYAKLINGKTLQNIYWGDASVSRLTVAANSNVSAFSIEKYDDSPDFFVSQNGSSNIKQISETNPFENQFKSGKAELIEYVNANGKKLQGILYYPDDYQPGKKHPMITYIYERLSDGFHRYETPSKTNYYSTRIFTSKGFFVFKPDIVFDAGDPGVSSVKTLELAVKAVVDKGLVDEKKVGLVGHSWGGYQTAFAVTRTNIFAAAVAGAGISNLVTMYGTLTPSFGNTFESGHMEVSQERMQVPPWEDMNGYLRNSAIPNIPKMQTPLLMEVGDADTNVNWGQGIQMYVAARRAKKEMVLLVYAKEGHGLRQEKNQIDYQKRILEWFGHYLKDEPAKRWVKEKISYPEQQKLLKERKLEE